MAEPSGFNWLPERGSTFADNVDPLFDFIFTVNLFGIGLVILVLLWIVTTWRRRSADQLAESQNKGGFAFASVLSVTMVGLGVAIVACGAGGALDMRTPPEGALEIRGEARSGKWAFAYAGVDKTQEALHVPAGQPARLVLSAKDAPTALSAPELRVKTVASPGRYASLWFNASKPGAYDIRGNGGAVIAKLHVHTAEAFADQLDQGFPAPGAKVDLVAMGEKLYTRKTCNACHSLDGTKGVGPTFKGLFGKDEALADGRTVKVDEAYIKKSIVEPAADVVKGYAPTMLPLELKAQQMDAIIAFIKSQK